MVPPAAPDLLPPLSGLLFLLSLLPPHAVSASAAAAPRAARRVIRFMGYLFSLRWEGSGPARLAENAGRDDEAPERGEHELYDDGHDDQHGAAADDQVVVVTGQPVDDVAAQTAEADV